MTFSDIALRYHVISCWGEEDDAFVAEMPELPGCAADGASPQAALAAFEMAARAWIQTAREPGRYIPVLRATSERVMKERL